MHLTTATNAQLTVFNGIAIVASIVIIYLLKKYTNEKLFCFGLALVLGGALGNLYDRITLGYVVDFFNFHINNHYWPAFNVADSAICVGVALLIWDSFKQEKT
jgi:signal peptidase II